MKRLSIFLAAVAMTVSLSCASQSATAQPTPCATIPTDAEAKPYHTYFFYTEFLNAEKYISYDARKLSLEGWLQQELSNGYVFHSITPTGKAPSLEAELLSHGADTWILVTTEYNPIAASCHPAYSPPTP